MICMRELIYNLTRLFLLLYLCSLSMTSCQTEPNTYDEQRTAINPTIDVDLIRYDQLINDLDSNILLEDYAASTRDILAFRRLHDEQLLGMTSDEGLEQELMLMLTDSSYRSLYEDIQKIYGDLSDMRPALNQMIENYLDVSGVSPDMAPDIYALISGFAYQAFVFDDGDKDGIGIGLEMFLGESFPYQELFGSDPSFSGYLTRTYDKAHMPRKIAEVLAEDLLGPPAGSDFLTLMMWGGKKLYLIDEMISFAPDSIVTEYTQAQLEWCRANEPEMWSHFFEEELFYETDLKKFNKLISPAPTSPGMPLESPGQTGNYMGWQVIKAYMKRHPDISVAEMISNQNAQEILDGSRYKPVR